MPSISGKRRFPWADVVLLILITGFILSFLAPCVLFLDTTPAGGDTASHVFTAWYLKHELLPKGLVSGWCMGNLGGFPMLQNYFFLPFLMMAGLSHAFPLTVAFKLVSILGVLLLPWVTWLFFRQLGHPRAVAVAGAIGSLFFLFNEGQSIWGGNILSTLSGTFCYSLGFSFAVLFLGCLYAHFHTRPRPVLCALCLALTGFCHGYSLLFAGFGSLFFLLTPGCFMRHLKSLSLIHGLGVGLMAFWLFPLLAYTPYTTKFGFEWVFQDSRDVITQVFPLVTLPCLVLSLGACACTVYHRFFRRHVHIETPFFFVVYLSLTGLFLYLLGARLKLVDVRFLPFFQFFLIIMAAFAFNRWSWGKPMPVTGMVFLLFGCFLWINTRETHIRDWSFHNFKGWENTRLWNDFDAVMKTLHGTVESPRVVYEHSPILEQAGSIRAFESIPFFSGRSTLEGLYIQASLPSPFIYYIQAELSARPSTPLEDYVFPDVNLDRAMAHLKLFHVNQVILTDPATQQKALAHPDYHLIQTAGPFMVFSLPFQSSAYVEPLAFTPALITQGPFRRHFFTWFRQSDLSMPLVYRKDPGPKDRNRMVEAVAGDIPHLKTPPLPGDGRQPDVRMSQDEILIHHATPHLPLLVKVSYHPNWKVEGADTIYLAAPGFMVIYPEQSTVRLHYSPSLPEYMGRFASIMALGLMLAWPVLSRKPTFFSPDAPPCESLGEKRLLAAGAAGMALVILTLSGMSSPSPEPRFVEARTLYAQKKYSQARSLFNGLTMAYPDRRFADDALFHLALCDYQLENWQGSLDSLNRLMADYPESRRVPEALFHMGLCYEKTNDSNRARPCYTTLIDRYGDTPWAREARHRLKETTTP